MKTCPGVGRVGLISFAFAYAVINPSAAGSAVDLWQARNGTGSSPTSPVEWVKGNAGSANSHYAEGHSIPYRIVLTGLSTGYHRLVIEWDSKQKGRHAIDYISHYDHLDPHTSFGDHILPEVVNPLSDLPNVSGAAGSFPIPTPSGAGSPVTNQPAASFASLPAGKRVITIWNGAITNVTYLNEGDLSVESATSQLAIEFIATNTTVVMAWGGHIATRLDWGVTRSAAGISGSSYHMRLISLDGSGGNQDRSLQAQAVVLPPACRMEGPINVCPGTTNVYFAGTDAANPGFSWSLANNAAGAVIVGRSNGPSVAVAASSAPYTVQVRIDGDGAHSTCGTDVTVLAPTTATLLVDQLACPGTTVTFSTATAGTGPFAFKWRKDGEVLDGATNTFLTLGQVTLTDEGLYCVEVTGACNAVTNCAALTIIPPPVITCPPAITVECFGDVPPPNAGAVFAASDFVEVSVVHVGDVAVTNGCEITIARRYKATDACGSSSFCDQTIRVRDTLAPVIVCAPDRVVECGTEWDFESPVASDRCTANVPVRQIGTVTNQLLGNLVSVTRTWEAMDACSNVATCSQTIRLQDTTPPEVACPGDITVVGSGSPGAQVVFAVTATDVCDTNPTVVCVPASGTIFPLGITVVRCEAADFSSNRGNCSFAVTVQDKEPPRIICPAAMTVAESPAGSGQAVVGYPPPVVTDNFDANPTMTCTPPSQAALGIGDTLVTCSARDGSGNMASCSFTVRVVPHTLTASSTGDSGPGTLRQALLDANAAPGTNVIRFAFPNDPPHIIQLLSPLPEITDTVMIDGWSQVGFAGDPLIEIDAAVVAPEVTNQGVGLFVSTGNCTIRGLAIYGFATGIHLEGGGANIVQGNFIGTDSTGTIAIGNSRDGIYVGSRSNLIGGPASEARNVISANFRSGIVLKTANATWNIVEGNFVGVAGDGTTPLGNGAEGIVLGDGAANNMIVGNVIAYNGGAGVLLENGSGTGNAIRGNSIHSNGGLGIDVNGDGVTDNDDGDRDDGPNQAQNFPVLSKAQTFGGSTTIEGMLNSTSNAVYQIDFFVSERAGLRIGKVFLGSSTVRAGSNATVSFSITFPLAVPPDYFISATATDSANNTSEFSAAVRVGSPPFISQQPSGTNVALGGTAMFCVDAQGSAPLLYQWRHNGANIPGATNACYTILNVQLSDGGSYSVVVANEFDAILSQEALLTFALPAVPAGDNFSQRVRLVGTNGTVAGNNILATREVGEPNHAGKPGGKSVWYSWIAPNTGIARFRTTGSTFDTLLAVYEGAAVGSLVPVSNDEDHGGFFTSDIRFNAFAGIEYQIVIDGFGGEAGVFVFDWEFEITNDLLPEVVTHPLSQTVTPGASCSFSVLAVANSIGGRDDRRGSDDDDDDGGGDPNARLRYQWFYNGRPIAGATNTTLTVSNVQEANLGDYWVQVRDGNRTIESRAATLQINLSGGVAQNVQARDKFLDAANAQPLSIGELLQAIASQGTYPELPGKIAGVGTVVSGFTGTQVFNTGTNTTSRLENICGIIGGASAWLSIVPSANGVLFVNTHDSTYDTVLAMFTRSPTNALMLELLDCNNNDGTNQTSAVAVPVVAGRTNFVLVDGVGGARGILKLNYSLVTPSTLVPLGVTDTGAYRFQVVGRPGMRFTIQRANGLSGWLPIFTTTSQNAVFEFIHSDTKPPGGTFYRVLMLP